MNNKLSRDSEPYATLSEASEWAQSNRIRTSRDWRSLGKSGRPSNMPCNPDLFYEDFHSNGGWASFLGSSYPSRSKKVFVSYGEASQWAKDQGVASSSHWRRLMKLGIPPGIPSYPDQHYGQTFIDGGGWHGFLGMKKIYRSSKVERCINYVLGDCFGFSIDTRHRIRDYSGVLREVDVFLEQPRIIIEYDGGWFHKRRIEKDKEKTISLTNSGYKVVRVRGSGLTLISGELDVSVDESASIGTQVKSIISHIIELSNKGSIQINSKHIKKLSRWMVDLETYNFRDVLSNYDGFLSLEEASLWAIKEGIKTQREWNDRRVVGLPSFIPSNPARTYAPHFKNNGGFGWFLGTGKIAPQKRIFLSYREASDWAIAQGISTQKEWYKKCNLGLPYNIPTDPFRVYGSDFIGWGDFLGTGRTRSKVNFKTYEEASDWAVKNGIKSARQWFDSSATILPPDIHRHPERKFLKEFSEHGWPGFLKTNTPRKNIKVTK